jgi:hypothetical protein
MLSVFMTPWQKPTACQSCHKTAVLCGSFLSEVLVQAAHRLSNVLAKSGDVFIHDMVHKRANGIDISNRSEVFKMTKSHKAWADTCHHCTRIQALRGTPWLENP